MDDQTRALASATEFVPLSPDTLNRLANGCRRIAARGKVVSPLGQELTSDDFDLIAMILSNLAGPEDSSE